MYKWIRAKLLRALRLPPAPRPPSGLPGSVRMFRAGENYYRLLLAGWVVAQAATLAGIIFSIGLLWKMTDEVELVRAEEAAAAASGPISNSSSEDRGGWQRSSWKYVVAPHAWWLLPLATVAEAGGIAAYVLQLVATGIGVRLEYELRWYIVTDRSLRIRSGIWRLKEATMSFANVQQVELSQGPVQRLLGIADVRVSSAGGGGGSNQEGGAHTDSLHTGIFRGVTNAAEIRDLILARLREFREAGLGDPDDAPPSVSANAVSVNPERSEILAAVRELLVEARALSRASRSVDS